MLSKKMNWRKSHTISVYRYNPENLKEVTGIDEFVIRYVPTPKWYIFLMLVNGVYTGVNFNLQAFIETNNSVRELIASAIRGYKEGVNQRYQHQVKINFPNTGVSNRTIKIFHYNILTINRFSNRDELTKYQLY